MFAISGPARSRWRWPAAAEWMSRRAAACAGFVCGRTRAGADGAGKRRCQQQGVARRSPAARVRVPARSWSQPPAAGSDRVRRTQITPLFATAATVPPIIETPRRRRDRDARRRPRARAPRARGHVQPVRRAATSRTAATASRSKTRVAAGGGTVKFTYLPEAPVSAQRRADQLPALEDLRRRQRVPQQRDDAAGHAARARVHGRAQRARRARDADGRRARVRVRHLHRRQRRRRPRRDRRPHLVLHGHVSLSRRRGRTDTPDNADTSGEPGPERRRAGSPATTTIPWIYAEPELYFSQMALNMQPEHVQASWTAGACSTPTSQTARTARRATRCSTRAGRQARSALERARAA